MMVPLLCNRTVAKFLAGLTTRVVGIKHSTGEGKIKERGRSPAKPLAWLVF
ncbi:hypothetical protein SAMN05519104_6905 [Rhizobiales bacterium GAS188]|nr:hypothetical protein SAMN05519104_6905 [Rhizobiales bacterium GAS188]